MLKRYQILLNEWQAEHYRKTAKKYDVSFSEMIRMALCIDVMQATKVAFPKHRFNIDDDLLKGVMKKQYILDETGAADFHNFLSRLYFEAHKATELWQEEKESA